MLHHRWIMGSLTAGVSLLANLLSHTSAKRTTLIPWKKKTDETNGNNETAMAWQKLSDTVRFKQGDLNSELYILETVLKRRVFYRL